MISRPSLQAAALAVVVTAAGSLGLGAVARASAPAAPPSRGGARPAPGSLPPRNKAARPRGQQSARARARVLFLEGVRLYNKGDYQAAVVRYQKAYGIFASPKIHTRLGQAFLWLGRPLKAIYHYQQFLKRFVPQNAADRALVVGSKADLKRLMGQVGHLQIALMSPPGAVLRVNGRRVAVAPFRGVIRVAPGPVNVAVARPNYVAFSRDLTLRPGERRRLQIELLKRRLRILRVPKIIRIRATPIHRRWWFWVAIGMVAAGVTGLAAGLGVDRTRKITLSGEPLRHDALGIRF